MKQVTQLNGKTDTATASTMASYPKHSTVQKSAARLLSLCSHRAHLIEARPPLRRTPFVTARPTSAWSRGFMNAFELLPSAAKRRFRFSDGNNSKAFIKSRAPALVGEAVTNGVRRNAVSALYAVVCVAVPSAYQVYLKVLLYFPCAHIHKIKPNMSSRWRSRGNGWARRHL